MGGARLLEASTGVSKGVLHTGFGCSAGRADHREGVGHKSNPHENCLGMAPGLRCAVLGCVGLCWVVLCCIVLRCIVLCCVVLFVVCGCVLFFWW